MVLLRFGRRAVRYAKILSTAPIRATDNNLDNRTPSMPPAWQKQVVKARSSVAARSCATNYIMREHERQCERAGVRQKAGPLWPARACERLRGNSRGKEGRGRDRERKRPASSAWATVASAAERHWKTSSRDHDDLMHRSISSHAKPRRRPQPCNLLEGEEEEGEEEEEEEQKGQRSGDTGRHNQLSLPIASISTTMECKDLENAWAVPASVAMKALCTQQHAAVEPQTGIR
ncbi:unnamed protein product [Prorocentrum cordatum]|uniref:Uncharacterized protein n=1 Tax=Prorocentrum cordatum TaxID=2364126 RepID=A0ABN9RW05_9DINO|nr:unnamed protein product [Polarella glacialis]